MRTLIHPDGPVRAIDAIFEWIGRSSMFGFVALEVGSWFSLENTNGVLKGIVSCITIVYMILKARNEYLTYKEKKTKKNEK